MAEIANSGRTLSSLHEYFASSLVYSEINLVPLVRVLDELPKRDSLVSCDAHYRL